MSPIGLVILTSSISNLLVFVVLIKNAYFGISLELKMQFFVRKEFDWYFLQADIFVSEA